MFKKVLIFAVHSSLVMAPLMAVAADPDAGKAKYAICAGCHGANGVSAAAANPSLAGKDATYIKEALTAYKSGTRVNATMKAMASGLSEADIDNIAAYVATFPKP